MVCYLTNGPFQNTRIVELGHVIAGPHAITFRADSGAEIVKIDQPGSGDMVGDLVPGASDGVAVRWKSLARNKRFFTFDWKSSEGQVIQNLYETHAFVRWPGKAELGIDGREMLAELGIPELALEALADKEIVAPPNVDQGEK